MNNKMRGKQIDTKWYDNDFTCGYRLKISLEFKFNNS